MHWTTPYLGKRWELGATGPDAFDCWGLVRDVYRGSSGVELPEVPGVAGLTPLRRHLAIDSLQSGAQAHGFVRVGAPVDMCIVLMSRGTVFDHVGVWVANGPSVGAVLHASQAGVVVTNLTALKALGITHFHYFVYGPPR